MRPVRFRVARPTPALEPMRTFYVDGLGLAPLGGFTDHDGYHGVMFGPEDGSWEIELTTCDGVGPCPAPSGDHLLVLYLAGPEEVSRVEARLRALGHEPVEPINPYWRGRSSTWVDPDGWRVVLFDDRAPRSSATP